MDLCDCQGRGCELCLPEICERCGDAAPELDSDGVCDLCRCYEDTAKERSQ